MDTAPWWGEFEVPEGQAGRWRIGPLTLWMEHRHREWRLTYHSTGEPMTSHRDITLPCAEPPPATTTQARFGTREASPQFHLEPRLADRPIVARPESPFYLPPGGEIVLFISTPLWVEVGLWRPAKMLLEIPSYRLSDTWFGASTTAGELCYALRTTARLEVSDIPLRPHRAVTPVLLRNTAEGALLFERIALPVPFLSLYADRNGLIWTEPVTLERRPDGAFDDIRLGAEPPKEAQGAVLISGPRRVAGTNILSRAFGALLG